METIILDTAFVDHGVPHVAFWNGRVLTAEDLRAEQGANQQTRRQLGRAVGAGVVAGLAVRRSAEPSRVEITAGLAVDRRGQTVELPVDISLSLVVPPDTAHGEGVFTVCEPIASTPTGTGLYLLVVRATSDSRSNVAGAPPFGTGVATECGPRYTVEGVSFSLVGIDPVPLAQVSGHDAADQIVLGSLGEAGEAATARNVLAHLFLGTRAWVARLVDPFGADPNAIEAGTLADLLADPVGPCGVPIALITWSFGGVDLVDLWSVRRPPTVAVELSAVQGLGGHHRERVGRATYCQFQDHLAAVLAELNGPARTAFRLVERFRHLPAAGLVPLARGTRPGFSLDVLDGLLARGPLPLAAEHVGALLDESVHHTAVDTASGEVLTVYMIADSAGDPDHLLFCTGRMTVVEAELVIDAVFPAGPLTLGQEIEVRGRNFGFSTGDGRIEFDGTNADALPGSTDTRLLVDIPQDLVVDPGGSQVTLEVTSDHGADSVPLTIGQPTLPPIGQLIVTWRSVEPSELVVGEPATLHYTVESSVVPGVEVTLRLDGTPSVVQEAEIRDDSGTAVTTVRLEPDESVDLQVFVLQTPRRFTLSLRALVGDIVGDDTREFVTDEPIPDADPDITIVSTDLDTQPAGAGTLTGSTLTLPEGVVGSLELAVEITREGRFEVVLEPVTSLVGWDVLLSEPLPPVDSLGPADLPDVTAADLQDDGKAERTVRIDLQQAQGPTASRGLRVVLHEKDDDRRTTTTYTLMPR